MKHFSESRKKITWKSGMNLRLSDWKRRRKITGVHVNKGNKETVIVPTQSVILACGGFEANKKERMRSTWVMNGKKRLSGAVSIIQVMALQWRLKQGRSVRGSTMAVMHTRQTIIPLNLVITANRVIFIRSHPILWG